MWKVTYICLGAAFLVLQAVAQTGNSPEDHCDYEVTSITARDSSTEAGNRQSDQMLIMVRKDAGRAAELSAETKGTAEHEEPVWGGWDNAENYKGSTSASWSGNESVKITSDGCNGGSSVKIELVDPNKLELSISAEKSGEREVKQSVLTWLESYRMVPEWTVGGEIKGSIEAVDYYNDGERLGLAANASGSITFGFPPADAQLLPIPVAGGAITVKPQVKFEALKFTFELSFRYDESKPEPWVAQPKGKLSAESGITLAATVQAGPDFLNVSVNGSASSNVNASGTVRRAGEKGIELSEAQANCGKFTLTFSVRAQVTAFQVTFYEVSGTWPERGGILNWKLERPILIIQL